MGYVGADDDERTFGLETVQLAEGHVGVHAVGVRFVEQRADEVGQLVALDDALVEYQVARRADQVDGGAVVGDALKVERIERVLDAPRVVAHGERHRGDGPC